MIPADPKWCSYCLKPSSYGMEEGQLCEHHLGPDGAHVPYSGRDVYEPSEFVLETVGHRYNTMFGVVFCFGFDPRHGFWVRDVESGEERNVSSRAIGKTVHQIRERA